MKENRQLVVRQHGGCLSLDVVVKPHIPVTLICVDTVKPHLADKVIDWCLDQATFADVKLLTDKPGFKHAVKIDPVNGIEAYSNFMIRDLHRYVSSSHCLVVQWDGYILNADAWTPQFLSYDYIGAPWFQFGGLVGNGGFSLRSKRLLDLLARHPFGDQPHPEDNYISMRHRQELVSLGMRFPQPDLAARFAMEGRKWDGVDWYGDPTAWSGEFGFHSFLTDISSSQYKPLVFHHSGDMGDVIYSLPVIKALGGGMLWFSNDCRYPYPKAPHTPSQNWAHSMGTLLNQQNYIWKSQHTPKLPHSIDHDLNAFRQFYIKPKRDNFLNIFDLHQMAFDTKYPPGEPWLKVDEPLKIEGRPIVINRTLRYRNGNFDWLKYTQRYGNQMVFIGSPEEYGMFCGEYQANAVAYHPTETLLDVAQIIAGAKVFIGNQSCPLAIAHGLCQNVIVECWQANPNCSLRRNGAIYGLTHTPDIPKDWL